VVFAKLFTALTSRCFLRNAQIYTFLFFQYAIVEISKLVLKVPETTRHHNIQPKDLFQQARRSSRHDDSLGEFVAKIESQNTGALFTC